MVRPYSMAASSSRALRSPSRAFMASPRAISAASRARSADRLCHPDLMTLRGHTAPVYSASFSPDGSRIVTAGNDKTAKVWDARSGGEALTLKGHTGFVRSAAFSPDGSRIVTGGDDNTAKVWDARPFQRSLLPRDLSSPPRAMR